MHGETNTKFVCICVKAATNSSPTATTLPQTAVRRPQRCHKQRSDGHTCHWRAFLSAVSTTLCPHMSLTRLPVSCQSYRLPVARSYSHATVYVLASVTVSATETCYKPVQSGPHLHILLVFNIFLQLRPNSKFLFSGSKSACISHLHNTCYTSWPSHS